jgi:hypothetical protein
MTILRATLSAFGVVGWIELMGTFVVAIGCVGELWILLNRLTLHIEPIGKNLSKFWRMLSWMDSRSRPLLVRLRIGGRKLPAAKEQLLERVFTLLVAFGVTVEFISLPISMLEIAKLNGEVAVLTKANLELEALIQPRQIISGMRDKLIADLKINCPPGTDVLIVYTSGDPESSRYASEFDKVFNEAGVSHFLSPWMGTQIPVGLLLLSPVPELDQKANAVRIILQTNRIPVAIERGKFVPNDRIQLLVGPKF